jgi:hypothetical protein
MVDAFILLDDVQYTKRDWRNRNRLKTPQGATWLSIPVAVKGKYVQSIAETQVSDAGWNAEHWKRIRHWYARAPHYSEGADWLEELYLGCSETYLSRINLRFLAGICARMGIDTPITWSMDYPHATEKNQQLIDLCKAVGGTHYLSGPSAQGYVDEAAFAEAGIAVEWMDYSGYAEHRQMHPPFDHYVSILDLILNEGPDARRFLKSAAV